MFVKMVALGLKRISVPVFSVSPITRSGACGCAEPVLLLVELAVAADGQRSDSDRALTTDTPTPCRPPETL
jgi:hypothetical protein